MKVAELSSASQRKPRLARRGQMARDEARWGYLLIAPMMIGFSVFFLIRKYRRKNAISGP